jgi:hypothetical protein
VLQTRYLARKVLRGEVNGERGVVKGGNSYLRQKIHRRLCPIPRKPSVSYWPVAVDLEWWHADRETQSQSLIAKKEYAGEMNTRFTFVDE